MLFNSHLHLVINNFLANDCSLGLTTGFTIGLLSIPLTTYIHECSHAVFAKLLFKNSNPKITLFNYGFGGICRFTTKKGLTKLGVLAGKNKANVMTAAAGPLTDLITIVAMYYLFPGSITSGFCLCQSIANASYTVTVQIPHFD